MTVYVLLFYISIGYGTASTGGPSVINGFTTEVGCDQALQQLTKRLGSKLDFAYCIKMEGMR